MSSQTSGGTYLSSGSGIELALSVTGNGTPMRVGMWDTFKPIAEI